MMHCAKQDIRFTNYNKPSGIDESKANPIQKYT